MDQTQLQQEYDKVLEKLGDLYSMLYESQALGLGSDDAYIKAQIADYEAQAKQIENQL